MKSLFDKEMKNPKFRKALIKLAKEAEKEPEKDFFKIKLKKKKKK